MQAHRRALLSGLLLTACLPSEARVQMQMAWLNRAKGWLNTPPLNPADLQGKVVLVDFWTYTCINWRRTLPYLRVWHERYRDNGLVIVGVHTPEFSFEKDADNVRRAVREQNISYPVAIDSDYAIWNAFDNNYWPAVYLLDAQGRMRHHQFGEGGYEKLEEVFRQLLTEAERRPANLPVGTVEGHGAEVFADWTNLRSPETYVGYAQAERLAGAPRIVRHRPDIYAPPPMLKLNEWALTGKWTIQQEFAVSSGPNSRVTYRFHARDVHLVMGPKTRGVPFRVSLDGKRPGLAHGVDVDAEGLGLADEPRMYHLIRQRERIEDRTFGIEFLDPGAEVFVFTFG